MFRQLSKSIEETIGHVDKLITPGADGKYPAFVRELALTKTKLQEAVMWLSMAQLTVDYNDLKEHAAETAEAIKEEAKE